jgi:N-acetylmuramoyl-L-alanine amidase
LRAPRLPALVATGIVLLTSLSVARASAGEPVSGAPYVIAIDPGHGGSPSSDPSVPWDPGVVLGPVMEKDITLDLAIRLRALLAAARVHVVMTRTGDQFVTIQDRWDRAHAASAQMFISLHVNAFDGDPSINGSTVFYPKDQSLPLARAVDAGLAQTLAPFQVVDDGVAAKPDLWVRSDIPTVTVEPAYLTNPHEAALLQRSDFRQAIVAGVFQGILAADPAVEVTRKAIDRAHSLAARQRAIALQPDATRIPLPAEWWVFLGGAAVLLLVVRTRLRGVATAVAARRRAPRRRGRRRRSLHRRA